MKNQFRMTALSLALLTLCACGSPGTTGPSAAEEPSAVEEPAAFGMTLEESAQEEQAEPAAETPAPADVIEEDSAVTEEDTPAPAAPQEDQTGQAIFSAVAAAYQDGVRYDPVEPGYFWRAVAYLVCRLGETAPGVALEGEFYRVPAETLDILVPALFGPYDGQYPSLGEENPFVAVEYADGAPVYIVTRRDLSELSAEISELSPQGDGASCTVDMELPGMPGERFLVTLTGPAAEGALFRYSIVGLTREGQAE